MFEDDKDPEESLNDSEDPAAQIDVSEGDRAPQHWLVDYPVPRSVCIWSSELFLSVQQKTNCGIH